MKINKRKFIVKNYWKNNILIRYEKEFSSTKTKLKKIFLKVFKEWSISDVELGCLTSGGLDSGFLSKFLKKYISKIKFLQVTRMKKVKMKGKLLYK